MWESLLAVRIHGSPTHASHVIRPRVRILLQANPRIAATTINIAVHIPWVETAFKPIEIPSIPEPETNIQTLGS
jgi:hypothetical protein